MNNKDFPQGPSKNISLFLKVMILGVSLACGYHAILGVMGFDFPWNTFLFRPDDRFSDWHNSVAQAASENPYLYSGPALATYFPASYILFQLGADSSRIDSIHIYFIISVVLLISIASLARSLARPLNFDLSASCFKDVVMLAGASLISYPVIFALDRGNIDLWIALLSVLFVTTQRSRFELLGLVALSIAIALKAYPAAFLLLLVSDRKYRSAIFCLFLALLMSVVTLNFMWDGFDRNLNGLLHNLNSYYQIYVLGKGSLFASSDPYNAVRMISFGVATILQGVLSPDFERPSMEILSYSILQFYSPLSFIFALTAAFFVVAVPAARWQRVTAICLIVILFPNVTNDYKLCNLLPGLYLLLFGNIESRSEKISFVLMCLLMIPKSYLFISGKPISMIINPLLLIALAFHVLGNRQNWRHGFKLLRFRILWQISVLPGGVWLVKCCCSGQLPRFLGRRHCSLII